MGSTAPPRPTPVPLYTAAERARRDASRWTVVQGVLAPVQFALFALSLALVLRTLASGEGALAAHLSVLAKTAALYAIMLTGALWERDVFGRYLFARPFFWEDVVSLGVIALHTLYVALLLGGIGTTTLQLEIALAAYAAYLVNAGQFLWKFRRARGGARAAAARTGSAARQEAQGVGAGALP